MSLFDHQYKDLILRIDREGVSNEGKEVRPRWHDGAPAYTTELLHQGFTFTPDEVPLLTQRNVPAKGARNELRWIWQFKSNNLDLADELGCHWWREWPYKDGETIGKAYGYQLGKKCRNVDGKLLDQVDYLLWGLKNNPDSRRYITELWIPEDLDQMSLTPCVHLTNWTVQNGKLFLKVECRSNDMVCGNPSNVYQYFLLWKMIAQVSGLECGLFYYDIWNAHVYDRHWDYLRKQFKNEEFPAPKLELNPDIKNFYDFKEEDIRLIDYQSTKMPRPEVAL